MRKAKPQTTADFTNAAHRCLDSFDASNEGAGEKLRQLQTIAPLDVVTLADMRPLMEDIEKANEQLVGHAPIMGTAVALPTSQPLYKILDELMELIAFSGEDLAPDERAAVDQRIAEYLSAEVAGKKVDGIAFTLRECERRAEIASQESRRINEHARAWEGRAERIKASTLRAMQSHGIRVLESPTNRLRVQANGGKEPLDVYAPSEVPAELKRFTLTLTGEQYARLRALVVEVDGITSPSPLLAVIRDARGEPDGEAIRREMKLTEPCPECEGMMDVIKGCERCQNRGVVEVGVPGARLLERSSHLRVE